MAATYDANTTVDGWTVSSLLTGAFTITSSANRAAILGLSFWTDLTGQTFSEILCGGQSGAAITDAAIWNAAGASGCKLFGVKQPDSGSGKTAHLHWTTAATASLGVITASGVDQTTPWNGGTSAATAYGTSVSRSVTSAAGDLTVTSCLTNAGDKAQTSNYTKQTSDFACMDTGPGTSNPTHTWSHAATTMVVAGANFVQYAAAGGSTTPGKMDTYRRRRVA